MLHAMRHPDPIQRILNSLFRVRCGHISVGERQFHVLINVQVANQIECLKDKTDLSISDTRSVCRSKAPTALLSADRCLRR